MTLSPELLKGTNISAWIFTDCHFPVGAHLTSARFRGLLLHTGGLAQSGLPSVRRRGSCGGGLCHQAVWGHHLMVLPQGPASYHIPGCGGRRAGQHRGDVTGLFSWRMSRKLTVGGSEGPSRAHLPGVFVKLQL